MVKILIKYLPYAEDREKYHMDKSNTSGMQIETPWGAMWSLFTIDRAKEQVALAFKEALQEACFLEDIEYQYDPYYEVGDDIDTSVIAIGLVPHDFSYTVYWNSASPYQKVIRMAIKDVWEKVNTKWLNPSIKNGDLNVRKLDKYLYRNDLV